MTLQESITFFEGLKTNTTNKSEITIYEKFLHILSKLNTREFSKEEIGIIEAELANLNLVSNPTDRKKYFKKALITFETFIKDTFSLIIKGHYTNLGIGLGTTFGILFGIVVLSRWERSLGISLGLAFGMVIGLTIGKSMDAKAKTENRVL